MLTRSSDCSSVGIVWSSLGVSYQRHAICHFHHRLRSVYILEHAHRLSVLGWHCWRSTTHAWRRNHCRFDEGVAKSKGNVCMGYRAKSVFHIRRAECTDNSSTWACLGSHCRRFHFRIPGMEMELLDSIHRCKISLLLVA
jgi:hypothetical protein